MLTSFKLTRSQMAQVNWKAVGFFYVVACSLSYGLHFLPNSTEGILPLHTIFTYGLGPLLATLLTRFLFTNSPKTITTLGSSPWRTILFVGIPLLLGVTFGIRNRAGQNEHLYGLLVPVAGILYGYVEETGWRGFLTDALRPLPVFWRIVGIGTLWLGWHFTFLPDLSAVAGPNTPAVVVYGLLVLASWGFGAATNRTKSVGVAACLHETFTLTASSSALILMLVIWTLLLWTWNKPVSLPRRVQFAF